MQREREREEKPADDGREEREGKAPLHPWEAEKVGRWAMGSIYQRIVATLATGDGFSRESLTLPPPHLRFTEPCLSLFACRRFLSQLSQGVFIWQPRKQQTRLRFPSPTASFPSRFPSHCVITCSRHRQHARSWDFVALASVSRLFLLTDPDLS